MAPWPNTFMIGTDLDTDFQSLNDLFETDDAVDPDAPPPFYPAYNDNLDGSRLFVGFLRFTWKRSGWTDNHIEILQDTFWEGLASVPLYVRTLTNRIDNNEDRIFRTYLAQALWPPNGEDKQAGYTLGFEIEFRHCILQAEAV